MNKLCLGTYLQILIRNTIKGTTQKELINRIVSLFTNDFDDSSTATSKLALGLNNPTNLIIVAANRLNADEKTALIDGFKEKIVELIDPNKKESIIRLLSILIKEDNSIADSTIINDISSLKKESLDGKSDDIAKFLAGLLLYVLRCTDNRKEKGEVNNIVDKIQAMEADYSFLVNEKKNDFVYTSGQDDELKELLRHQKKMDEERIEREAREFCIKYSDKRKLIYLCQIANITSPLTKHGREMYNEYCRLSSATQKKILDLYEMHHIKECEGELWWYKYLDCFIKEYREYDLGSKDYEYLFYQYFHRAESRGIIDIRYFHDRIFCPTVMSQTGYDNDLDVLGLIDEYVYYKEMPQYRNSFTRPMDKIWKMANLASCDEDDLLVWLCLFIEGTCWGIRRCDQNDYDKAEVIMDLPNRNNLETMEDMFLYTLLSLYEVYGNL
ncbi:MAG: hypothetical protein IK014_00600 [Lachnospiraceae bacterium]|nr:hypothetical protein [Lachnospiraceae bacterium]